MISRSKQKVKDQGRVLKKGSFPAPCSLSQIPFVMVCFLQMITIIIGVTFETKDKVEDESEDRVSLLFSIIDMITADATMLMLLYLSHKNIEDNQKIALVASA